MPSNILFVFEGETLENQIANSLKKHFFSENVIIKCSFCADIYQLYDKISDDTDLDTFVLLKEIPQNKKLLANYHRDDFAEIYMFFDYDGHDKFKADDDKVKSVLNFFNDETGSGKLFISYPMVEALKHYSDTIDFKNLKVNAKENIGYKNLVNIEAINTLKDIRKYTKNIWIQLIELHLSKMNQIVHDDFAIPQELIPQNIVFQNQLEKYIQIDKTVAVLSSFPIFVFDYYGFEQLIVILKQQK